MVGLSNMISLMSVSQHSDTNESFRVQPSKLGGINTIGSKFGAFGYFPGLVDESKSNSGQ
jgi:hypothetical protein